MTASNKRTPRTRSPRSPSMSLQEAYDAAATIYDEFHQAELAPEDVATALGHTSATSGPFKQKFFSMREVGLLEEVDEAGSAVKVATDFLDLRDYDRDSPDFRETAVRLLKQSSVYKEILDEFTDRLPNAQLLGRRLERQGFTPERGQEVAEQLLESLRWAGVINAENRFVESLSPDAEDQAEGSAGDDGSENGSGESTTAVGSGGPPVDVRPDLLRLEVPTDAGDRVVILYPPAITRPDADRVATVLSAVVGS